VLNSQLLAQTNNFVQINNTENVNKKINNFSKSIKTLKSNFVQEKYLSVLEKPLISNGKFAFKKQNKILWQYTNPINYTIAINNGTFVIKDEQKTSKYDIESNPVFKQINELILSSIKGDIINNNNFELNFFENKNLYLAIMIPKNPNLKKIISKIEMSFSKKDFSVEKVKMIETNEDYTIIRFKNKQKNIEIPDNVFDIQ